MRSTYIRSSIVVVATLLTAGLASLLSRGVDLESALAVLALGVFGLPTIAGVSGILLAMSHGPFRGVWVAVLVVCQVATAIIVGDLAGFGVEIMLVVLGLVLIGAIPGALIGTVRWDEIGASPTIEYGDWGDR